jgi:hypothetical protein
MYLASVHVPNNLTQFCSRWTVRNVVVHLIASAQAQAIPIEFVHQVVAGRPLTAQIGGQHRVDGLNEAQLRARRDWTWPLLPDHDVLDLDRHPPRRLHGHPGDRSRRDVEAWTLDRYRDAQLVESRIIMDIAGLLTRLGVLPAVR